MNVLDQLKRDEGCRLTAYPDPLTGGEPWTIGYGCTGPDVKKGTVWSQALADAALRDRVETIETSLRRELSWYAGLSEARQAVLVGMAYNMGISGLLAFRHMLGQVRVGNYNEAAADMMDSRWARQVPERAARLAEQLATGRWV